MVLHLFTFFMLRGQVTDKKHVVGKFGKFLELINTQRVVAFEPVTDAFYTKNATASHELPSRENYEWSEMNPSNFSFGETLNDWFAFKGKLKVPECFDKNKHYLHFEFNVQANYLVRRWDDDFPAGPEGRFWIDGKVVAAIDEFHHGAVITGGENVEVRIFTGRCKCAHNLSRFGVSVVDKNTEALYHRVRFLASLIREMAKDNMDRAKLITIVDTALRELDIRDLSWPISLPEVRKHDPNGTAFYASVPKALQVLKDLMGKLPKPTEDDLGISVLGYSHIDTCWEWPYSITHFKSANTAAGMVHLMEHPPHEFEHNGVQWKFLATGPQHYKWLKKDSPEIYAKVVDAAKKGRWDVNGVMWVEPDTTLPSGESLVRQITEGVRFLEKELGAKQTVLFLPDCFGFSGNLPQITRKAGIDSFVTSKISWCEYTEFPYHTFRWRGIDGSEIFAHFVTTPSSWSHETFTYTGVSTAYEMVGTLQCYKQKDILPHSALHTSGNGDGGGGITEEMVWNLNLMAEMPRVKDVPTLRFPTLEELFVPIREKADVLPVWDDELYLEYHRGTLTSQEEVKRQNRMLEAHLHNAEWLAVVVSSCLGEDVKDITAQLQEIWEDTLLFHFHDAIPGSSVNEANIDIIAKGRPHLQKLREIEDLLTKKIAQKIRTPTKEHPVIVFNTLSHPRSVDGQTIPSGGWTVKEDTTLIHVDEQETTMYERVAKDESHIVHTLKEPFISTLVPPHKVSSVVIERESRTVRTPFFTVTFGEDGSMSSVKDAKTGREYLSRPGNIFEFYEDRPLNWPAWDIQLYHKEMQLPGPTLSRIEFGEGSVTTVHTIPPIGEEKGGETTITQTITFSADAPFIDCRTVVNWTQHNKLLKVAFPTTVRARTARYGIQFGHIERPTHVNTDRDMAKFEVAGRWADLSDSSSGVSLCSNVKAGFDVHDGVVRMSLLKAPLQTDKWADYGVRKFDYRVVFHDGGFGNSNIVALSDELNVPVATTEYVQPSTPISDDALPATAEFVVVDNAKVVVETLKPAFDVDGFVVRVYEASGGWQKATVRFPLLDNSKWEVIPVNLLEKPVEAKVKQNGTPQLSFDIELRAFELESVLLKRK